MRRKLLVMAVFSVMMPSGCVPRGRVRPAGPRHGSLGSGREGRKARQRILRRMGQLEAELGRAKVGSCQRRRLGVRLGWLHLLSGVDRNRAWTLFASGGPDSVVADLGLALMEETRERRQDAVRHYMAMLRALVDSSRVSCGDDKLIESGRCSLARFAVRRLEVLLENLPAGMRPKDLLSVATRLPCGWASRHVKLIARQQALRLGISALARRIEAQTVCPRQWRVSVATGLGALDIFEGTKLSFGASRIVSSPDCSLSLTHPDGLPGVARAESEITLSRRRKLLFWIDGDRRPFRFLLDGRPVFLPGRSWDWPAVVRRTCVELSKGTHRLTLEIPVGAGRTVPEFWVTDLQSGSIGSRAFGMPGSARDAAAGGRGAMVGLCTPGRWPDVLRVDGDLAPLAFLMRAMDAALVGEMDVAEALARRLASGHFVEALWLTAGADFFPAGLTPDEVRERSLARLARALRVAPGEETILRRLVDLQVSLGKVDSILSDRGGWASKYKEAWWFLAAKVRIFLDRYWTQMARNVLDGLLRMGKNRLGPWRLAWDVGWQLADAGLERRAALRLRVMDAGDDHWARFLLRTGRTKDAVAEYRRLVELGASARRDAAGLARALTAAGRTKEAVSVLGRLLSQERWNVSLWMDLVNGLLRTGHRKQAMHALRDALAVRPDSREIRRALVAGQGGLGLAGLERDGLEAIRRYQRSKVADGFSPGPVFVLDDMVTRVFPGGGMITLVHQLLHFRRGTDLGLWGQIPIPSGAEVLRLRVIKKDGRILVPSPADNGPVNLPGIEVGDYAEFEFLEGYRPLGALAGGFAGPRFFFATTRAATVGSRYQILVPSGMRLQVDRRGGAPLAVRSRFRGQVLLTWQGPRHDRVRMEAHAPPEDLWLPSVRVSSGVGWERLAAASRRRFVVADRPSAGMRDLARRYCRGPGRGFKALYDWVTGRIEQAGTLSDRASVVMARHRGYRLNLLRGLLRLCGADVSTVMIRPTHRAGPDGAVKDLRPYAYAALELREGDKIWYLFPFLKYIPFGFLPAMLRGAPAVRVEGPRIGTFVTPNDAGRDRVHVTVDLRFDSRGRGLARVVERLEGWPAIQLRRGAERSTRHDFESAFQRERAGAVFPGATTRDVKFLVNPGRKDAVTLTYEVSSQMLLRFQGDSLTMRRSFFGLHLARRYLRGTQDRQLPIQVGAFPDFELDLSVTPPKGWHIVSSSVDTLVESRWGTVRRSRSKVGRKLRFRIRRRIPFSRVPAAAVRQLSRFCRRADAAETLMVTFARSL